METHPKFGPFKDLTSELRAGGTSDNATCPFEDRRLREMRACYARRRS